MDEEHTGLGGQKRDTPVHSIQSDLALGQEHKIPLVNLLLEAGFSKTEARRLAKAKCRRADNGVVTLDFTSEPVDCIRLGRHYLVYYAEGWSKEKWREVFPVFTIWECGCWKTRWKSLFTEPPPDYTPCPNHAGFWPNYAERMWEKA